MALRYRTVRNRERGHAADATPTGRARHHDWKLAQAEGAKGGNAALHWRWLSFRRCNRISNLQILKELTGIPNPTLSANFLPFVFNHLDSPVGSWGQHAFSSPSETVCKFLELPRRAKWW
jgi:hypothetical protein